MAQKKKSVQRKTTVKATALKKKPARKNAATRQVAKPPVSEEYADYLQRYELYGEGRARLKSSEFDELDDELLDLLAQELDHGLSDDQSIRLKELEFLLLDSEQ